MVNKIHKDLNNIYIYKIYENSKIYFYFNSEIFY